MKTQAINNNDITNTGTGPLKKKEKTHVVLVHFCNVKILIFFVKSKDSINLHFDSRGVVSVKSPHSSGTGTSGSSRYGSSSSPTGCSFSLTNGSTTTSSSWRSRWGTSSTSSNIGSTCSWSRLEKIISTLIVLNGKNLTLKNSRLFNEKPSNSIPLNKYFLRYGSYGV